MTSSTPTNPTIILDSPEQYHAWFTHVKGSVPEDLWMYFDPEGDAEFVPPVPVTFESIQPEALSFQQLSALNKTHYTAQKQLYNYELQQYQRYVGEKSKLSQKITGSVSAGKQHMKGDLCVRANHLRSDRDDAIVLHELFQ
jgi:hypothetical protein